MAQLPHPGRAESRRLTAMELTARSSVAALTLGALGVVFGDIGTSPLYALHTVFAAGDGAIDPTRDAVYGVISMVFWAITLVVTIKYVALILRVDNDGEGGIMALIALVQRLREGGGAAPRAALVALGIFGAALFFGDAMITPAISVLSAVEGLEVVDEGLGRLVVPIAVVLLVGLFAVQRFGTEAVGRLFGPVCALWFLVLAAGGVAEIAEHPGVLAALSPTYGIGFALDHPGWFALALTGVVLTITGVEALYADMGHFSRRAIRLAWFVAVLPALTLNYLGQGALIVEQGDAALENPFFLLYPDWARIPVIVLATAATIIASQAVISGAFSVARQAVSLGFLPRLTIRHTSEREVGQVYVPAVNWGVLLAVLALVLGFQGSENLAAAYGIAVTGTLAIDTVLFFTVLRSRSRRPAWLLAAGAALFLLVDLTFFGANVPKVVEGGWFPLLIAAGVFTVFMTWSRGREVVSRRRTAAEGPLRAFVEELRERDPPVRRVPGTAVFLNANRDTTPLALRANVEHNHTLHETVVIVTVQVRNAPHVAPVRRVKVDDLGYRDDGILHVTLRYGFQDETDVPADLALAAMSGLEVELDLREASWFLSRISLRRGPDGAMPRWRTALFLTLTRFSSDPVAYFRLPVDRTVVMGGHIDV